MDASNEKLLITVVEAGRLCGLSRSKSYELARNGSWPTIRCGRAVRVPVEALRRWVELQTEGGPPAGTE